MATGEWRGFATRVDLAQAWGVAESTVQNYACEAGRRLRLDADALDQERIAHAVFCERVQREALAQRNLVTGLPDFGAALKATELAAKFKGIDLEPPKRVELTGKNGGPVALSLDELDAARDAVADNVGPDRPESEGEVPR